MSRDNELKPCPFCGGKAWIEETRLYVACDKCYASTGCRDSVQELIDCWNNLTGRWISVKDRLPEDDREAVMFLNSREHIFIDNAWGNAYGLEEKLITHWQPLPAPPEGDG